MNWLPIKFKNLEIAYAYRLIANLLLSLIVKFEFIGFWCKREYQHDWSLGWARSSVVLSVAFRAVSCGTSQVPIPS